MSYHSRITEGQASCSLWWVRAALGRSDFSDPRFIAYMQVLVDQYRFPPPFPSQPKGRQLTRSVTAHSSFRRDAVEAWLDQYLPSDCAARLDAAAMQAAAAALDANAAGLGRLKLVEGGAA